jgi:ribonuclease P protein component
MVTRQASHSSDPPLADRALDAGAQHGRCKLSARFRLRRRGDFDRTMSAGVRVSDKRLTLWALPNRLEVSRFGMIVGRKHGTAVRRNRLRRILREAFRLARTRLPVGLDLVCAPRTAADIGLQAVRESLVRLAELASQRLAKPRRETQEPGRARSP